MQLAILHLIDHIASPCDVLRAVAGQPDGFVLRLEALEQVMHLLHGRLVHRVERLIQNQHVRVFHERLRKAQPLTLAERILPDGLLLVRVKPQLDHGAPGPEPVRPAGHRRKEHEVLQARFVRQEARRLNDHARVGGKVGYPANDARIGLGQLRIPPERGLAADQAAVDDDIPGRRLGEAADAAHQRRLAAAVRTDEAVDCHFMQMHGDPLQHAVAAVLLAHIFHRNHSPLLLPGKLDVHPLHAPVHQRCEHPVQQ